MPTLKIQRTTDTQAQEAYSKIKEVMDNDRELRKLDPDFKCEFNDQSQVISAKGKKFKAEINVSSNGSGAAVNVLVDLPLMLAPFKGMIEGTLNKKLDKALG